MARPMIAELLRYGSDSTYRPSLKARIGQAHVFRCDSEFVAASNGFLEDVDMRKFTPAVRLPFPVCFLEWLLDDVPSNPLVDHNIITGKPHDTGFLARWNPKNLYVGCLVEETAAGAKGTYYCATQGTYRVVPGIASCEFNRMTLTLAPDMNPYLARTFEFEKVRSEEDIRALATFASCAQSTLTEALALLGFLQFAPKVVNVVQGPGGRRLVGGRDVPRMAHKTLMLNVPAEVAIQRVAHAGGWHVREHDVRGHWREIVAGGADCGHEYELLDDFHRRCIRCGRKLSWVKEHRRGHSDLGEIRKDYRLRANA